MKVLVLEAIFPQELAHGLPFIWLNSGLDLDEEKANERLETSSYLSEPSGRPPGTEYVVQRRMRSRLISTAAIRSRNGGPALPEEIHARETGLILNRLQTKNPEPGSRALGGSNARVLGFLTSDSPDGTR